MRDTDDGRDVLHFEALRAGRLDEYRAKTAPLVPYYEEQGLLRRVDGVGSKDEIRRRIFAVLGL